MTSRRKEYELSIEQELPASWDGAPRRARLTARFYGEAADSAPDDAELAKSLRELADRLARASEAGGLGKRATGYRPDRPLGELLETYRPRQMELVELLHADGELTEGEYTALRARMSEPSAEPPLTRTASPPPSAPPRSVGRSVEELLRTYQITSLRQAGAVRARRQISFEEYMSLKRHFAASDVNSPTAGPTA
jgi:hypothetical protein